LRQGVSSSAISPIGETVRARKPDRCADLTAKELLIARLASQGNSKPGDQQQAVHQPAHRRVAPGNVFVKLALTSRKALQVLARPGLRRVKKFSRR
jgi:hypothetical protein